MIEQIIRRDQLAMPLEDNAKHLPQKVNDNLTACYFGNHLLSTTSAASAGTS